MESKKSASAKAEVKTEIKNEEERVFVYLGPSKSGLIQAGSIFKAKTKAEIPDIALALEKIPEIKRLIVRDTEIRETQEKLRQGNNAIANAYKAIAEAEI